MQRLLLFGLAALARQYTESRRASAHDHREDPSRV